MGGVFAVHRYITLIDRCTGNCEGKNEHAGGGRHWLNPVPLQKGGASIRTLGFFNAKGEAPVKSCHESAVFVVSRLLPSRGPQCQAVDEQSLAGEGGVLSFHDAPAPGVEGAVRGHLFGEPGQPLEEFNERLVVS